MKVSTLVALARRIIYSRRVRTYLAVWSVVLVMSGQGFRHLVGLPAFAALCLGTVIAVAVAFAASRKPLNVPFLIAAFVGLAALSIVWSATRGLTAVAVLVLIATTFLAAASVRGVGTVAFVPVLYRGLQISLLGGLAFEFIVATIFRRPIYPLVGDLADIKVDGVETTPLEWSQNLLFEGGPIQGFVGNRNPFGAIALLAGILALVLLLEGRIRRADGWLTLAAAATVHALTLSATVSVSALYVTGLVLAAIVIRRVPESFKRVVSFGTLAVTAVAGVLTLKYRDDLFAIFDRGADATNRTDIWREVIRVAEQRPEGWGFVGYWPVWEDPYAGIVQEVDLLTSHAHNAFLDAWFQVGLVGLVLLLVIVALLFGSAWRLVERASRGDTYIPLGWALLTAAMVLQALTESRLLVEGGWFLLVALYCSGPQIFRLTIVDPELVHKGARIQPETPIDGTAQVPAESQN